MATTSRLLLSSDNSPVCVTTTLSIHTAAPPNLALPPPAARTESYKRSVESLDLAATFAGCCCFLREKFLHNSEAVQLKRLSLHTERVDIAPKISSEPFLREVLNVNFSIMIKISCCRLKKNILGLL